MNDGPNGKRENNPPRHLHPVPPPLEPKTRGSPILAYCATYLSRCCQPLMEFVRDYFLTNALALRKSRTIGENYGFQNAVPCYVFQVLFKAIGGGLPALDCTHPTA